MNELQIISMTDKTPIEILLQVGEDNRVSSKDVYKFLNLADGQYARWARTNILENDFAVNGEDFEGFDIRVEGNITTDYRLSVPFAKKLCMLSKTERGEQARDYFVKVEDALKRMANNLPALTTNEMILQLAQSAVEIERRVAVQDEKILAIEQTVQASGERIDKTIKAFASPSYNTWKSDMDSIIESIVVASGNSNVQFRGKLYKELERLTGADLQSRITRKRNRMKKYGASSNERKYLTKLDIINADKKLRPVFESIVKGYQALYCPQA